MAIYLKTGAGSTKINPQNMSSVWVKTSDGVEKVWGGGVALNTLPEGSLIGIQENSTLVPFILLTSNYQNSGRTLLIRKDIAQNQAWNSTRSNVYNGSAIDVWMNGTYLNQIESGVRNSIAEVEISATQGGQNSTAITLNRKVFLLSFTEVGFSGNPYVNVEGSPIGYFDSVTRRIAMLNGVATRWWLRTPCNSNSYSVMDVYLDGGSSGNYGSETTSQWGARPAFTLADDFAVSSEPNEQGYYLPV